MSRVAYFAWAMGLWLAVAGPVTAQSDLQAEAEAALVAGDPARTAALAQTMLRENDRNFAALLLLALAQSDLGDNASAARTAAAAYDAAPDPASRVQAARLVGSTRFAMRQYARAEFWLRRAANDVTTDDEAEAVVREYIRTIETNPLSLDFTAYVAPSDNVNGGSEEGVLRFEGLDFEFLLPENRQALSGIELAGSARLTYRIAQSETQRTSLTGFVSGRTYRLSQEARDLLDASPIEDVRGLEGSDFATLLAEVGITHERTNLSPFGPVTLRLNYGSFWQSDTRVVDYRDVIFQHFFPIDDRNAFNLLTSWRDQQAVMSETVDSTIYDVIGSYSHVLGNRDQLQLNFGWRESDSGFENRYVEYRAGINYGLGEPVLGTRLSTSLEVGYRTYDEFITTLDGRDDRFVTAQANLVFEEITYFGFSPSMSISATRTESNAEEETTAAFQVLLGIESNF